MATARSPSPNPSRPRTPDVRKSCTSIPSSMSGHHHRNHGCRSPSPSRRASLEHKENERDLSNASKPSAATARSPASGMSSSLAKGTKSFMAPTISATSKAVTASPRRTILAEKNEAVPSAVVRSSLTSLLAESRASEEVPVRREAGLGTRSHQDAAKAPKESSGMFSAVSDPRTVDLEIKNLCASGVLSPYRLSPAAPMAPLDVDPFLPPYDPHTNYLSPRPRFLHYRPNPRIDQCLFDESGLTEDAVDGKRLEDSFTSESCEDTQGQVEEEQSTNLEKDCQESSSSSEVELMGGDTINSPVPEPEFDTKPTGKGRFFTWYKFTSFLLVLAIACFFGSFMGCPVMPSSSMLKTPPDISAMDRLHVMDYLAASAINFKQVGRRLGKSLIFFASYATVTTISREEFGPIFLANLTASIVEQRLDIDHSYIIEHTNRGIDKEQPFEGEVQQSVEEDEVKFSGDEQEDDTMYEDGKSGIDVAEEPEEIPPFEEEIEEATMDKHEDDVSRDELQGGTVFEDEHSEIYVTQDLEESDVLLDDSEVHEKLQNDGTEECNSVKKIEETEINKNVGVGIDAIKSESYNELELNNDFVTEYVHDYGASFASEHSGSDKTPLVSGDEHELSSNLLQENVSLHGSDGKFAAGIFSAVSLLAALFVFLLMKQKKIPLFDNKLEVPPAKEISKSVSGSSESHGLAKGSPFENNPVDMLLADSGPTEFSSSLHSSTPRKEMEETLSQDRRDSVVSLSSTSYGSFTTYEKCSAKKGNRDEEVMTPVRRSSRLRNQIASP
ncbi:hypothetical protein Cni_G00383 [Canna indica]|uniref:Uncharacterized protein n=1 Tax=Canna indica TaxID=4628 RepID=A0AAQ3JL91_9LILI|nr:hypothetical protein Cni_G00383 [Canna indica]